MLRLLLQLIVGHYFCDYPLQGDFLAKAKNHKNPIPGVPWYQALIAHSAIQAGMVAFFTGSIELGIAEMVVHSVADWAKSEGILSFNQDQSIHLICKLGWASFVCLS